jgi:hypothetical protein
MEIAILGGVPNGGRNTAEESRGEQLFSALFC